jgi:hypothetical protein
MDWTEYCYDSIEYIIYAVEISIICRLCTVHIELISHCATAFIFVDIGAYI